MSREGIHRLMCVTAGGLCGLGCLSSAIASPPFSHQRSSASTIDSARFVSMASRSLTQQLHASTTQLDLRPPGGSPPLAMHNGTAELVSTPFPSAIHHLDLGKADLDTDDRIERSALGANGPSFRMMSQPEILARRIHREGLPVARLWESKSAFLSLGLNQRGKPGLWLIQKTH
jgi:hypothetical protein